MSTSWGEALAPLTQSYSINAAVQAFHGNKAAMVAAFAGTTDRKSSAYQTASRNINRWQAAQNPTYGPLREGEKAKQARHISPASQKKLDAAVRDKIKKDNPRPHINMAGTIAINGYGEDYEREREIDKAISWDDLEELAGAYDQGGDEAANEAFADWYGMGDIQSFEMVSGDITIDY
jgi:hypothetical protein